MANLFKKALGLFVEFEPDGNSAPSPGSNTAAYIPQVQDAPLKATAAAMSAEDVDKFEQHFLRLFEQSNLPGPDYFEFWKMMETLESHLPEEKARMSAVFATLGVQGLTKDKLLQTAAQYKMIVEQDRQQFDKAAGDKASQEIEGRKHQLADLEKAIADNAALIQKLTQEIQAAKDNANALRTEVTEYERKIAVSRQGYQVASEAMINKIITDIQKIQTSL
ncbi:hypothetical protein MKQ68_19620 [Chitinophaga horti]|uniref:Uncharacterized protein n=1 Tax=Chitinophaga horti TaxID=2920382 RepID=A0ABY6IY51_9BACT|nr:hypothetical protein [Chitinophaga horti]UYQ92299.1 hypothetical protein MKQ68_19620 [Chitinophaga horti]